MFLFPVAARAANAAVQTKPPVVHLTNSGATPITPEEAINIKIYKTCSRAVVNITSIAQSEDIIFNITPNEGVGSGTIISPEGYILTNYHVINGASQVKVTLYDGSAYPASLIGDDPANDLAVLKINVPAEKKLVTIPFGDSASLEVGRRVFAIGNPFTFDRTMTAGIVSSLGRTLRASNNRLIKDVIQTDAAINPGNSGGPLLDTGGKMVGITTAIFSLAKQNSGIGLAVPVNTAKRLVPELIAHHGISRPDIGIQQVQLTAKGLLIIKMDPEGPAARAGLQGPKLVVYRDGPFVFQNIDVGLADVIVAVDSQAIKSVDDLLSYIEQKKAGQVVTLTVLREGHSLKIPVKLSTGSST
jgi:S1-C subfamily serine protease